MVDGRAFDSPLPPSRDEVRRYGDLGVDRLILIPQPTTHAAINRYIDSAVQNLIGKV